MAHIKESELRELKLAQSVNDFNQLLAWLAEDGEIVVVQDEKLVEDDVDALIELEEIEAAEEAAEEAVLAELEEDAEAGEEE